MGFGRKMTLFCAGGAIYVALELLWRGRSHGSMFLAGGSSFMLLGKVGQATKNPGLRALGGAGAITAVEFAAGFLFNRSYRVWDYRNMPYNLKGQICLPFSLLWVSLGQVGMWIYEKFDRFLFKITQKPLDK